PSVPREVAGGPNTTAGAGIPSAHNDIRDDTIRRNGDSHGARVGAVSDHIGPGGVLYETGDSRMRSRFTRFLEAIGPCHAWEHGRWWPISCAAAVLNRLDGRR